MLGGLVLGVAVMVVIWGMFSGGGWSSGSVTRDIFGGLRIRLWK
jgi:hypothetical protein